jgi:hypothetical protein
MGGSFAACAPMQPLARPIVPDRAPAVLACALDQMRGAGFMATSSAARPDAVHGQRRTTQGERSWNDVLTARTHPDLEHGGWVLELFLGTGLYNHVGSAPPASGLARSTAYAILEACAPRTPTAAAPPA